MKFSKKAKSIFTILGSLTAASVMVVPALTLSSCSSASNSYYPKTKINIANTNQQILGVNIPEKLTLNNGANQIYWENTYYGFNNVDQISAMYKSVTNETGLNIYQPSKDAVSKFSKDHNNENWYEINGCKPLVDNFDLVNRLPFVALNALNVFQFSQSIAIDYAKFLQKSLVNLGVECFNENNAFSILKNISFNKKEFKQWMYGLTIGIGQAGSSYFLGISDLDIQINGDGISLDPNNSDSWTNPGKLVGTPGQYIKEIPNSSPKKYEIDYDKLTNDTTKFVTITPKITYSWYKQLQTGGEPIDTTAEFDKLKDTIDSLSKNNVYKELGSLKQNYALELKPITFALKQDVSFKDLDLDKDGIPEFTKSSQAFTTGAVVPISLVNSKQVNLNYGVFETPPANLLDYAINAASFQLLNQAVNKLQVNGNDNHIDWTNNLYKLPYFGYSKYQNLIEPQNTLWSKASIKSNQIFLEKYKNVQEWFDKQIGDNGKQWISLSSIPTNGHLEKLIESFNK